VSNVDDILVEEYLKLKAQNKFLYD